MCTCVQDISIEFNVLDEKKVIIKHFFIGPTKKAIVRSPEKQEFAKKPPALSLVLNSQSKQLSLTQNTKVGATTNQENGKFCTICNLPLCKIADESGNKNNRSDKSNSNTISIMVDKDELCRIICNVSENTLSTQNNNSEKGSSNDNVAKGDKYCVACDLPKCRLEELFLEEQKEVTKDKDPSIITAANPNEASLGNDVDGEEKYCSLCKAPKCEITANFNEDPIEGQYDDPSVNKGSKYCSLCNAPKCKIAENFNEDQIEGKNGDTSTNKGSDYCDLCKAPKCKIDEQLSENPKMSELPSSNVTRVDRRTGTSETKSKPENSLFGNPNRSEEESKPADSKIVSVVKRMYSKSGSSNSTSPNDTKSSNLAEIVVDRNDICQICTEEELNSLSSDTNLDIRNTDVDIRNSPTYCNACKLPKCKYETGSKAVEGVQSPSRMSNRSAITINVEKSQFCSLLCEGVTSPIKAISTQNVDNSLMDKSKYCNICNAQNCKLNINATNATKKTESQEKTSLNSNYRKDNIHFH